jgi:hypothetical protein
VRRGCADGDGERAAVIGDCGAGVECAVSGGECGGECIGGGECGSGGECRAGGESDRGGGTGDAGDACCGDANTGGVVGGDAGCDDVSADDHG